MKMRCLLLPAFACLIAEKASSQRVPQQTVVEHFTNTYCSICAGRNPGFYGNLSGFPDVLHLAYYPSAPYPACPFNQMNKAENDARTAFYGIYGATPRIVINGSVVAANANYTDASIFQNEAGKTSAFTISIQSTFVTADSGNVTITVRKVAADPVERVSLFAVLTEDTVMFNAANGETVHYDVFHKSITGTGSLPAFTLANVGDSARVSFSLTVSKSWGSSHITAILQDSVHHGLQAARSGRVSAMGVPLVAGKPLALFPIPAGDDLNIRNDLAGYYNYAISNGIGQIVMRGVYYAGGSAISLRGLESGFYIITLGEGTAAVRARFVRIDPE